MAFAIAIFAVVELAKDVLIPLSLSLLISFILLPVAKKIENFGANKSLAAFVAIFMSFIIVGGGITLFSNEIIRLSEQMNNFVNKLTNTFSDAIIFANKNINFSEDLNRDKLIENGKSWLKDSSGAILNQTFNNSAEIFAWFISTIIFTFLILVYRTGLINAILAFYNDEHKATAHRMLKNIQRVGKQYLTGTFILMVIIGLANSIGLWIIGIDSPFLFGFLAAMLTIVPYIGTTTGATIPVFYAFMTSDSIWVPVAVIGLFWGIQTIESNYLGPKVLGKNLNVNSLAAILSLLIGATMWGVAGMILFLPFAAILKVICEEYEQLKPIALLISNDISKVKRKPKSIIILEKIKYHITKRVR